MPSPIVNRRIDTVINSTKYYDEEDDLEVILGDYNDYSDLDDIDSDSDELEEKINPNMYTMMCKNILERGECKRGKCTFAHTIDQLRPVKCKYDHKCVNKKCTFIHSKETKEQYFKRLNISHLKAKEQVKCFIIKTDLKHAKEDFAIALHSGHKYFTIIIKDEIWLV